MAVVGGSQRFRQNHREVNGRVERVLLARHDSGGIWGGGGRGKVRGPGQKNQLFLPGHSPKKKTHTKLGKENTMGKKLNLPLHEKKRS